MKTMQPDPNSLKDDQKATLTTLKRVNTIKHATDATDGTNTEPMQPNNRKNRLTSKDWLQIEVEYRAGIKTMIEVAAHYKCSVSAISQMAKRKGWTKDIAGKAKVLAQEKVNEAIERTSLEVGIVDAVAERIAAIDLKHKDEMERTRRIAQTMLDELECMSGLEGDANLQELGDIVLEGCPMKLRSAYRKVISLPNKIGMIKTLADTIKTLIQLEREVNKMNGVGDVVEDALANVLNSIATRNNSALIPMPLDVDYVERKQLKDVTP